MTILDTIVAQKKREVEQQKSNVSVAALEQKPLFSLACKSLKQSLLDTTKTGIIAEFKRQSPSKGVINGTADLVEVTNAYAAFGASGISVLTDESFFGGNLSDLEAVQQQAIPVLRKDFMIDPYQIVEAKAYGASVILLIAACLSKEAVKQMTQVAHHLGMEVLLEIHNEAELDHVYPDIDLVGVNNRNLKNFEVDIAVSLDLIQQIPKSIPAIAESGIDNPDTIVTLQKAGFAGFLIGERFMKETDPSIAFANFVNTLKQTQNAG